MKNQFLKTLLKMITMLILSATAGTLMLSAAYSLPTHRIKYNVQKSAEQIAAEGDHFSIFSDLRFTDSDNYSDANYLNAALIDNSAKGWSTGLYGLRYENALTPVPCDSPVTVLKNVFQENADLQYREYGRRFWNGYEVVIKPLLMFFTYGQIRNLNYYLEAALLMLMALLMHKCNLTRYIIPLVISFLLSGPVTIASSMAFSGFFYCTYVPCILMLVFNSRLKQRQQYQLFFMAIGIWVAYFNMNYIQLLTFAYALIFYYLLNGFPKSVKNVIETFILLFVCWFIGFSGMYIMKWIFYELFTGLPLISDMIARTLYRVSATAYYTGPHISRLGALCRNIKYIIINIPWMMIELSYILWAIFAIRNNRSGHCLSEIIRSKASMLVLLVLMTVLVLLRYLIFANHVYVHAWVTYRIADAVIFLFNVVIMNYSSGANHEKISDADEI